MTKITYNEAKQALNKSNRKQIGVIADMKRPNKRILTKESNNGSLYLGNKGTIKYDFKNVDDGGYNAKKEAEKEREYLKKEKEKDKVYANEEKRRKKLRPSLETDKPKFEVISKKLKKYQDEYNKEGISEEKKKQLSDKFEEEQHKLNRLFMVLSKAEYEKLRKGKHPSGLPLTHPSEFPFWKKIDFKLPNQALEYNKYKSAKDDYITYNGKGNGSPSAVITYKRIMPVLI
jgi:hypothetical protein